MKKFNSKDYCIFKIRYYASDYLLKKWREGAAQPKQHYYRAEQLTKFKWELIKKITGRTHNYYWKLYMVETTECVFDELVEFHNVLTLDNEKYFLLLIPVKKKKLIEWVKENVKLPYIILNKTRSYFYFERLKHNVSNNGRRERAKQFSEKRLLKWFKEDNTRKLLIEKHHNG